MGDLVRSGTLKATVGKVYDSAAGAYITTSTDTAIEGVIDKFTFNEQQAEDFVQSDLKFVVFNPTNDLAVSVADYIVLDGVQYTIRKIDATYLGSMRPVITLVLRK
jgi:hypothetical protein